jgi:hypothetical protein
MPIILDQALYNRIKREADKIYEKPSAYKSGWIVKTYKSRGGAYEDDNKPKNLGRWFKEDWGDIGGQDYPVYRPTKRVSKETPLTADEIDPKQAKEQIALKQDIKGEANLPAFKAKGSGLYKITDYTKKQAKRLGVQVFPSDNPKKKIEVYDKNGLFITYAGGAGYKDFPTYTAEKGLEYAKKRQALYKLRHEKDRHKVGSAGYYADQLLW